MLGAHLVGRWSNLTNMFQMGWFNHQLGFEFSMRFKGTTDTIQFVLPAIVFTRFGFRGVGVDDSKQRLLVFPGIFGFEVYILEGWNTWVVATQRFLGFILQKNSGKMDPIWLAHMILFKWVGSFNHQLEKSER